MTISHDQQHALSRPAAPLIAVDTGALARTSDGIQRYLSNLLPRMISSGSACWHLYGRTHPGRSWPRADVDSRVRTYADGLPAGAGGVASLFTSQPFWAMQHQPDVYWSPAHRLPAWLPAKTARVVTIHDLCWRHAATTMRWATRTLDSSLMPQALVRADRVIAVSRATRDSLLDLDRRLADRAVMVHEAAEPLPPPLERAALASDAITSPYVFFVGSLEPRKNLARLIEAFAGLSLAARERHLLVIAGGKGWGPVDVPGMAKRFGIADRVRALGPIDDQRLSTLYRHARCLAMPSLYEGFGLPVLEALSQGTPVLIAGGSSLPEVAGDAGLVVDPLSVDSIRVGLESLLADDVLHGRLAAAATPQASKFSWERAARETLAVFEEAIAVRREKIRLGVV